MSVSTSRSERRRKSRKRPLSLVYVELALGNGGMMRDLSEEGFAVRAMMPLQAGQATPFSFSLNESVRVEGQGQILWVAEEGRVAGVKFAEMTPEMRQQIRDWLIRPEAPVSREKPVEKKEATLEELREEMHSVPPRPDGTHPMPESGEVAGRTAEPVPNAPEPAANPPTAVTSTPAVNSIAQSEPVESPVPEGAKRVPPPVDPIEHAAKATPPVVEPEEPTAEPMHVPEALPDATQETEAPALPRLRLPADQAGASARPADTTPRVVAPERSAASPPWKPIPDPIEVARIAAEMNRKSAAAEAVEEQAHAVPVLPDISDILIQPPAMAAKPQVDPFQTLDADALSRQNSRAHFSIAQLFTIMMVLAAIAGGYVFHREVGQQFIRVGVMLGGDEPRRMPDTATPVPTAAIGQTAAPSSGGQATAQQPSTQQPGQQEPAATEASNEPEKGSQNDATVPNPGNANTAPANPPTIAPKTEVPTTNPAATPYVEPGQSEYTQAMQVLRARNGAGLSEALRLLWVSVEKGNPNAEVELAQMYWRGRGVKKNCDQALILLTAAARKGSAEAQRNLQEFRRQGCE